MTDNNEAHADYILERVFAAPIQTVWRTWTEPALFARWYKPDPKCETAVLQHELRPGGVMRYEMRFGNMPTHYERWIFDLIEPPSRLRWKQTLTDVAGNIVANPRMPDWPRVMLTTIELQSRGDGTLQRLTWQPYEASAAELAAFRSAAPFLEKGWAGGFNNLGELLKELVAAK
jgi:uncharacterized protein YndB with AHSA1/START domain